MDEKKDEAPEAEVKADVKAPGPLNKMAPPFKKKGADAPLPGAPAVIPAVAAAPVVAKAKRYIVKRDKVISWYGSMTTMAKGSVVDAHSYGEHGMQRILDQGVELEEIKD